MLRRDSLDEADDLPRNHGRLFDMWKVARVDDLAVLGARQRCSKFTTI
jgi:hypothetical protein